MPVQKLSISLPPALVAELDARGDERSGTLARHMERYLAILDASHRRLADLLSDAEIGLVLDTLNGTRFADTISIQLVHAEVAYAISMDRLDRKWKVDGPALVKKRRALSYADSAALVDAVERWWNRSAAGEVPKPGEALRPKPKRAK